MVRSGEVEGMKEGSMRERRFERFVPKESPLFSLVVTFTTLSEAEEEIATWEEAKRKKCSLSLSLP